MQHGKNFHEIKMPHLFGILGRTSTKSHMNGDVDYGVVVEEVNINVVKARVDRMRAEAFQTSHFALV
jgi:hypothetical protein